MALFTMEQLERIEAYLADGRALDILPALKGLVADMETYIDEHCVTTDETQYFSFPSEFENLTYRRIEEDPRTIVVTDLPFDRAYSDLAFCHLAADDRESAAACMKQAIRWNPMNCAYRLNLASLMADLGQYEEYLGLTYSVFARAASPEHLVHAWLNFADYFERCEDWDTAAACLKAALHMSPENHHVVNAVSKLVLEHGVDPHTMDDKEVDRLLDAQGIPDGANVEVVLSALLLADLSAAAGDPESCKRLALMCIDLVGQEKAMALAQIVQEEGAQQYPEDEACMGYATTGEFASPAASATLDAASRVASGTDAE